MEQDISRKSTYTMSENIIYSKTVCMDENDIKNFIELIGMNSLDAELSYKKHKQYKIIITEVSKGK